MSQSGRYADITAKLKSLRKDFPADNDNELAEARRRIAALLREEKNESDSDNISGRDATISAKLFALRNNLPDATNNEAHNKVTSQYIDALERPVRFSEIDREANQRFGKEANMLFGAEARKVYATPINNAKRAAAKNDVDKIRAYSSYISLGTGLLMTCATSNFGLPVSLAVGAISALATHLVLPLGLDSLEDYAASKAEPQIHLKVKAVY